MGRPFADTTVAEPHTSRLHTFLRSLPKQATQAHSTPHHSTIAGVGRPDHSQPLHPYMFTCAFIELSPAAPCPNQCKLPTSAMRAHPTEQCIHDRQFVMHQLLHTQTSMSAHISSMPAGHQDAAHSPDTSRDHMTHPWLRSTMCADACRLLLTWSQRECDLA